MEEKATINNGASLAIKYVFIHHSHQYGRVNVAIKQNRKYYTNGGGAPFRTFGYTHLIALHGMTCMRTEFFYYLH